MSGQSLGQMLGRVGKVYLPDGQAVEPDNILVA